MRLMLNVITARSISALAPMSRASANGDGVGDKNSDGRTAASIVGVTRDRDLAAAHFDKPFRDPQTNSGSEISFSGEERLENPRQMFLWDPRSVVLNSRLNPLSGGTNNLSGGDLKFPPWRIASAAFATILEKTCSNSPFLTCTV
jgi:hypothetical protein